MSPLIFVDLANEAEFMISSGGFDKFTAVVPDPGLTEFICEECFSVVGGVDKGCGAVVVALGGDRFFFF